MNLKSIRLIACALLAMPVLADYMLPETDARLLFVVDEWKLAWDDAKDEGKPTVTLTFEREGKMVTWGVDEFWLADRIASDSICTGSHREEMKKYVTGLQALQPAPSLLVEQVRVKDTPGFFVAGLWAIDAEAAYTRGCEHGSHVLGLSADEVKACGSAEAYVKLIRDRCTPSWGQLDELRKSAPAPKGPELK